MSLISAWMFAHAQLVAENQHSELWQINEPSAVIQLVERVNCLPIKHHNQHYYCRDGTTKIWHIQTLNGRFFAQSFALNQQQAVLERTWLGRQIMAQEIEPYQIAIFESSQRAKTLADRFSFRYGARLTSIREIEYGRYHIILENPETSVLVVQQQAGTHTVQITKWTKPH